MRTLLVNLPSEEVEVAAVDDQVAEAVEAEPTVISESSVVVELAAVADMAVDLVALLLLDTAAEASVDLPLLLTAVELPHTEAVPEAATEVAATETHPEVVAQASLGGKLPHFDVCSISVFFRLNL